MNSNERQARGAGYSACLRLLMLIALAAPAISIAQQDSAPPALTMAASLSPPPSTQTATIAQAPSDGGAMPMGAMPTVGRSETAGVEPKTDSAPSMKLGAGDMVALEVYGRPELSISTYVSDNGTIAVPLAGPVSVGGMSPADAASRVADAFRSGGYLLQPQVTLTLKQFRSQQISILGEVHTPGRYALESRSTIFDLLAQAGGVSTDAGDTIYLLRTDGRGQSQRMPVSLRDFGKRLGAELTLQGGDTIYVPKAPQFYIYGEVHAPNRYRLDAGMTVMQAIALGGGITERGSDRRVEIRRRNDDGSYTSIDARATDEVEADDVIRIKERIF